MVHWNFTSWMDEVVFATNLEIRQMAARAFQRILERTPVRTGRLKAGWSLELLESSGLVEAKIVNDVEYAVFVENGTPKMAPRHMVALTMLELEQGLL